MIMKGQLTYNPPFGSRWGDANSVRKCMAYQKIQKQPGLAFFKKRVFCELFAGESESKSGCVLYYTKFYDHQQQ